MQDAAQEMFWDDSILNLKSDKVLNAFFDLWWHSQFHAINVQSLAGLT